MKRDFFDYCKFVLEIIGLIALVVYTSYTIKMYCANRKSANAAASAADTAAKTMRIDQRAWLSPNVIHQIFKKDQPLLATVDFGNTGKTPAIHVQTCVVAEIVGSTRQSVDLSCPESSKSPGMGVIFPASHTFRLANATGKGGKTDVDPQGLLRAPLMEELRHWRKSVYVYGRVEYLDIFKKPHWSTFCSTMLIMPATVGGLSETVSWTSCAYGNDVDPEDDGSR